MSYANTTEAIEALAANIGEAVYMDIAKWHLYLENAHLHTVLAERLYPLLSQDECTEAQVTTVLQNIAVPVGGGRRTLPLLELIPPQGLEALMTVLADYQHQL